MSSDGADMIPKLWKVNISINDNGPYIAVAPQRLDSSRARVQPALRSR